MKTEFWLFGKFETPLKCAGRGLPGRHVRKYRPHAPASSPNAGCVCVWVRALDIRGVISSARFVIGFGNLFAQTHALGQ